MSKQLPDDLPDADLELCKRIEAAYADFLTRAGESERAAALTALDSLYDELVALNQRNQDAEIDTLHALGQRAPLALGMMTFLGLPTSED